MWKLCNHWQSNTSKQGNDNHYVYIYSKQIFNVHIILLIPYIVCQEFRCRSILPFLRIFPRASRMICSSHPFIRSTTFLITSFRRCSIFFLLRFDSHRMTSYCSCEITKSVSFTSSLKFSQAIYIQSPFF